jgi:cytochrome c peroxidase
MLLFTTVFVTAVACKSPAPPPGDSAKPVATAPLAKPAEPSASADVDPARLSAFGPLPADFAGGLELTEAKLALGRQLYYEKRLSKNHDISCNTCHVLASYGVDGLPVSNGHKGQKGARNSPTVYNAAGHSVQFWDGRAATVEAQATGPITNPEEMAMADGAAVAKVLRSIPEYVAAFKAAFPRDKSPVTYENAAAAIGAFERKLTTPSRFDKFLAGDKEALTADERRGLNTFVETGCTICHSGVLVGGSMYQELGLVKPYRDTSDLGRFAETKQEADKMFFKVPSLRNVDKTAPYLHNGKIASLSEMVKLMAEYQLGKTLTEPQVAAIVSFLGSLTGELPTDFIKEPTLPKSTAATPKPDPT